MTQRVSETGVLTGIHLILIVILMALTIIGIIWGSRLKRRRDAAEREEAERIEAAGIEPRVPDSDISATENVVDTDAKPAGSQAKAASLATESSTKVGEASAEIARSAPPHPLKATAAPAPAEKPTINPPLIPAPPPLANEPLVAAAPLDASPASLAIDMSEDRPAGEPANGPVTQLKGLGPKAATLLAEQGITTIGQIAALDSDAATALDARLGSFTGRMARDRWVEQARSLASGDLAGFEAAFGKL